jgi:hypothetical protein
MHSAGVGKMRRSFASLKMTGWMDAMDSGDPTPENIAQVQDRDPFFIFESAATTCVRRYDPSHALSGTERGQGVLLESRYSRRSFMLTGRKLALTLAFTVLGGLTFGVSCRGFFPKPILQSIAINPTAPQVNVGQTQNLQLFGTYDDGTRSPVTSGVSWSSVPASVATVTGTGSATLTGVASGSATITASAQALSATANATVIGNVSKITVSPASGSTHHGGTGQAFTFAATPGPPLFITADNGGTLVITPNDGNITCTVSTDSNTNPDELCTAAAVGTPPYSIVMTYPSSTGGTVTSNTATLAVN